MRVRYTTFALADLSSILDYIEAFSPKGAKRLQARIKTSIGFLTKHPALGSRTDDPDIRRLVVTPYPYLIFYQVFDSEILIHAIRHSARDPSTMPDRSDHTP